MVTVYTVCAVAGVVVLLSQVVMTFFGLDSDNEPIMEVGDDLEVGDELADHHGMSTWFFGVLTFRSVTAFVAFFGLGGRMAVGFDLGGFVAFVWALGLGTAAMVAVALLMRLLHDLHSEGNVRIESALGTTGTVYLTVPGHRSGTGKVEVSVQGRSMTYPAITGADELRTGSRVKVVGISDPNTLEISIDEGTAGN
jgi:membrane protein implicated in regulation of membrane protease activity